MVGDSCNDGGPDLDGAKRSTLIRNGLVSYVESSGGDIDHIALHGSYAGWALERLRSTGYRQASVSESSETGMVGSVWHVDIDQMVLDYSPRL
tara:strand:+ start:56 stop:334 length:279 start_codon:yes stop_codon:yes gene_type:complete